MTAFTDSPSTSLSERALGRTVSIIKRARAADDQPRQSRLERLVDLAMLSRSPD